MFTLNYFWFFVVATLFTSAVVQYAASQQVGLNPLPKYIAMVVGPLSFFALIIMLIIGFWKMPHWWHPIVMFLIGSFVVTLPASLSRNANFVIVLTGLLLAPTFVVLAYLGLFGVI
jgi:hypothetical protein